MTLWRNMANQEIVYNTSTYRLFKVRRCMISGLKSGPAQNLLKTICAAVGGIPEKTGAIWFRTGHYNKRWPYLESFWTWFIRVNLMWPCTRSGAGYKNVWIDLSKKPYLSRIAHMPNSKCPYAAIYAIRVGKWNSMTVENSAMPTNVSLCRFWLFKGSFQPTKNQTVFLSLA